MGLSRSEEILEATLRGEYYTKEPLSRVEALLKELNKAIIDGGGGGGEGLHFEVVEELPTSDISTHTIYMMRSTQDGEEDYYTEYAYINGNWEKLGHQPTGEGIDFEKLDNKPAEIDKEFIDSLFD